MAIQLTNSLTKKKETFVPLEPGKVKMYVCGPTVYNLIHIGNARVNVFYEVVDRFLTFSGYQVTRVMNFTDVDDKIINKAREEKSISTQVSEKYIKEFLADMKELGIKPPTVAPKVSDHIPEIISMIEKLIENKVAYVAPDGEVFYSVRNFPEYGKLSGKKIDDLLSGARIAPDEKKKDPLDFSLWKPQKVADEVAWDSPWGKGRPGWHIECSAMATRYLGETFDLHGGGMDLIHPHHENEIAQSEGATKKPYVKYWMHSNMLTFNAEKMSKSLGNIMLLRDFMKKYTAETLRFYLLSAHYRSTLDYSDKQIKDTQTALHRIYSALKKSKQFESVEPRKQVAESPEEKTLKEYGAAFQKNWKEAMEDDFNTAKVFSYIFDYVRHVNAYLDKKGFQPTPQTKNIVGTFLSEMKTLSGVLNILGEEPVAYLNQLKSLILKERGLSEGDILAAIEKRTQARQNKDFLTSDKIRDEMLAKGIELRDLGAHTEWDVSFNN